MFEEQNVTISGKSERSTHRRKSKNKRKKKSASRKVPVKLESNPIRLSEQAIGLDDWTNLPYAEYQINQFNEGED